jgi:Ca-activated chloride channel family protein
MRFATAVAAFGQKLRGDTQLSEFSYQDAIKLATDAKGEDKHGYRAEFIQLMRLAENLE